MKCVDDFLMNMSWKLYNHVIILTGQFRTIQTSGSDLKGHEKNLKKKFERKIETGLFGLRCSARVLEKESSCMCTLYLLMTIELQVLTGRAVSMCDNERSLGSWTVRGPVVLIHVYPALSPSWLTLKQSTLNSQSNLSFTGRPMITH